MNADQGRPKQIAIQNKNNVLRVGEVKADKVKGFETGRNDKSGAQSVPEG